MAKINDTPEIIDYEDQHEALDFIDEIYEDATERVNKGIPLLNDSMNYWIKTNQAPVQMDRVLRV